jgi:CRISPR/Cas system-associated endoribonuclease Cas2
MANGVRINFIKELLNELSKLVEEFQNTENEIKKLVIIVQIAEKIYKVVEETIKHLSETHEIKVDWNKQSAYEHVINEICKRTKNKDLTKKLNKTWRIAKDKLHIKVFHEVPYNNREELFNVVLENYKLLRENISKILGEDL